MSARDFYNVTYRHKNSNNRSGRTNGVTIINSHQDILDNDTEFNANQFKLYDDFTTDMRIVNFSTLRANNFFQEINNSGRNAEGTMVGRNKAGATKGRIGDPNDSGVDLENGNHHDDATTSNDSDLLENEVMVDPWSSMESSNSPLTDSGPSASEDCTPSTSSDPPRMSLDTTSPLSPDPRNLRDAADRTKTKTNGPNQTKNKEGTTSVGDEARARALTLDLETLDTNPALPRRPHFLDDDYQTPSRSNFDCRIPKPHFLDHSPSPDEFDERSDITNPNFLDDDAIEGDDTQNLQKRAGAFPKRPQRVQNLNAIAHDDRPNRINYRSALHFGLENAARSSERDKRESQLYRGTWPGEREVWTGHDTASVRSFSSNGSSDTPRPSSNLENKMECVYSLLSLLTLSPDNNADLSGPLLEMSRSVESCIAMRKAGCIPLLVQLIHSKLQRETRDRAAKALRNIIHTQTDDKAGRREARVWRLLEQVREYCYILEDVVESRKEDKELIEDDASKHPSQCVAALMKLSFDEEHRHVVCQLGGLQALAALVSGDQAAHGSRTDDSTCLTMRRYAGMTLTNLTFGDGNNKSLLCSFKDFMVALVEQLESPNDDMRQVTAAVLRNLSWRADTNSKQVLREVSAVKGLTKAAMTCQKEATLKSVLSALWNLTAHCSMNKVALCSVDGALGFLVDMLSYNSPTKTLAIIENAGGIMRNVSSHIAVREDYRQILRERNCLSVLLQHLKSPSLTVVSNSCGTLWNLSARCPQDQQFLWDHGAVPMLRSLIHSKHKMIAMGSSAALKNLLNSKPGKSHIIALDSTARNMNLPALPTLGVRKQKALEQELDQNLAETCDNIEPATSPTTSNREEKNLFTATERQIAMNLERHRMTASSPLMANLSSQISLSHSAHMASYLSCSNTLLKGALVSRSAGSENNVNRSDSKDSVTSTHSDSVFERVTRTGKVPIPTPRNKDLVKTETANEVFTVASKPKETTFVRYPNQPPIPPPRSSTDMRTNYTESGYDVDQDSCDQPIDYSRKYSETKSNDQLRERPLLEDKVDVGMSSEPTKKYAKKENAETYGDYQETDLDQPTDYSLRYAEHQSETGSDISEPPGPSVHEDTIKHFCTEGTPYETPIIFSTATSMSDLRVIGPKDQKAKTATNVKENPEVMTHSDEKDTCSIEDPPRHDNDRAVVSCQSAAAKPIPEKRGTVFDTKFSSGMISPEKPVNYCDEGTPGYFSRVSSLSSLGEPTEEDSLAKKNAMATINANVDLSEGNFSPVKDKEGLKAVTFASDPVATSSQSETPGNASVRTSTPPQGFVEDTPLMFSRSSSLGSLPECEQQDDQGSVVSEISRLPSGCISPSEIPDSPAHSVPSSPPRPHTAPATPPPLGPPSVFEERVSQFVVENTPAHFSTATSLSELTIPDDTKPLFEQLLEEGGDVDPLASDDHRQYHVSENRMSSVPLENHLSSSNKNDTPKVYFTEDTPAILSKAGSHSDLSALSIESGRGMHTHIDTSDSSNLSDAGDLLEQCIQKGIHVVMKNKGPTSEPQMCSSTNPFLAEDRVYTTLPPYLRSSTETVKMSHDSALSRNVGDSGSESSPPPPLPPKSCSAVAPPRPPLPTLSHGRRHESRLPIKMQRTTKDRPKPSNASNLTRNDSLSSLSLDSFGSTDREIFEETVKAGVSANYNMEIKSKAHSVERPSESVRQATRHHRSLDRSEKITQHKQKCREVEFERNPKPIKRLETEFSALTRSPYSYHGDTVTESLAHHSRWNIKGQRIHDDGPPSLPARIDAVPRLLERSNSLSSLSNDSFGSTDKEVFERCVRVGMTKATPKREDKPRVRSDDRLEVRETHRSRRRRPEAPPRPQPGALDRMVGEEYSKDRAILEEVIARGAGEKPPNVQSKNVPAPFVGRASADGNAGNAQYITPLRNGSDPVVEGHDSALDTSCESHALDITRDSIDPLDRSNEYPTVDSGNTTFESADGDEMQRSNEFLAPKSINTTLESEIKDELDRSNESYADVLDGSMSDFGSPPKNSTGTLTRPKNKSDWTDIKMSDKQVDLDEVSSKKSIDTWNDNTCPDDVTFPTLSGSIHMAASIRSDILDPGNALPDLLEKSGMAAMSSGPDITNNRSKQECDRLLLESIPEPSFMSLLEESEPKYDSLMSTVIEKEAARLAAQLKNSQYVMENSVTSLTSLDLDNIKPPSNLGSLLSLSASGQWEETQGSKKSSQKTRKKSLPVALMVKRALSNSLHQGSSEYLDSNPVSFLDNVKPPSEMENLDMENSMLSVSSIASEVVETKEKIPVVFDLNQPIQDFPLYNNFTLFQDLDQVNPPSLFEEMAESTVGMEPTTAQQVFDDCISNTLNIVTDLPSGSENCSPLPSDVSSVESTPKRSRNSKYLTPKEKRQASKDRYQTYTITDSVSENDVGLEVNSEEFLTWTKSESDSRSDDYVTATSEPKVKRKISAKQRRQEDRARYQTQTVNIGNILTQPSQADTQIEDLKYRLAAKKSLKQKRIEDADRFRTRTINEDIPPSPTYVTKDANFENIETTTGYDSLSSNELNQQVVEEARQDHDFSIDIDSGHNEDDFELNTTQMQTYTRSFRNYLPVIESPAAVDFCVVNNLKNIEMTASYQRSLQQEFNNNPSTSDFASYEGDTDRDDICHSDFETETPLAKPKPKIIKPEERHDESLDSNESLDKEPLPKSVRGRKKAMYVSPYRRNIPTAKTPATIKSVVPIQKSSKNAIKVPASTKQPTKLQTSPKTPPTNTSPKRMAPNKSSPSKIVKPISIPIVPVKPLPIERQGTFTKEDSCLTKDPTTAEKKTIPSRVTKATIPTKPSNTSPSRLPQPNRFGPTRPILKKANSNETKQVKNKSSFPMKNSASNHSLQSSDSGKTVTLASKSASRQGSTSSVNSIPATKTKDVESRIANLWKKVEQSKKQATKPDKRVWIESEKPKLIRSSTFEGQPKQSQLSAAPKQKSAIAMRVSQIPSLRPKTSPVKTASQIASATKKPVGKVFVRKQLNGQSS